ncbi:hypothetical protein SAMN02744787_4302 [Bacillus subtilis]|nr:hypothetical protein NRS6185_00483 [Bacillus subtilis]SMF53831.1 hypothetical protein SAMN02744787_4302 [Bacillus subtilis]SNY80355.1 hypothetical protein SAMN02744790_04375 [Bacillus subtilis]SPY21246.1 Uncharacterised protein [Bacillus subtilis]
MKAKEPLHIIVRGFSLNIHMAYLRILAFL